MTKNKLDISQQCSGILELFDPKDLMDLIEQIMSLHDIYNVSEQVDKEVDEELGGELREVRLVMTAVTLSKIADKHGKAFRLINIRYPNFHGLCQKIADEQEKNESI